MLTEGDGVVVVKGATTIVQQLFATGNERRGRGEERRGEGEGGREGRQGGEERKRMFINDQHRIEFLVWTEIAEGEDSGIRGRGVPQDKRQSHSRGQQGRSNQAEEGAE